MPKRSPGYGTSGRHHCDPPCTNATAAGAATVAAQAAGATVAAAIPTGTRTDAATTSASATTSTEYM